MKRASMVSGRVRGVAHPTWGGAAYYRRVAPCIVGNDPGAPEGKLQIVSRTDFVSYPILDFI